MDGYRGDRPPGFVFMNNDHDPRIAIVSSAGIFPGAADLDAFWRNIVAGRSAIQPVPPGRWPVDPGTVYDAMGPPDKARSLNAGLIHDLAFHADGFDMPPEALLPLDPMHHLVLEAGRRAWQACRQERLDPNRVDVVLAAIALPTDAASRLTRRLFLQAAEAKLFEGTSSNTPKRLDAHEAMAAGVTAFPAALLGAALGLGGDTLTLDAACASSLFALKLACDALHARRADAVLAGGVARPDTLYTQIGFTQLQALSRSGRCAPFDHSADGLVVGEGCGMVVLKRLADALAQGDTIQGLICGLGLSNDMRGNLLAPETQGQVRAMQAAYAAAGWDPGDVDLIECHGAATPVGDATELHSLRTLWGDDGWQTGQCAIGSIKSMIGHLLTAAGAAGLIKVLLGMRHELLPPSLNFEEAPASSPLHGGPFRVQTAATPWVPRDDATPRRAAVSAFGFGGINAHLLLEEWRPPPAAADSPPVATVHRRPDREPVAVVGLDVLLGPADGLEAFQTAVFQGRSAFESPSERRWKNCRTWVKAYLEGEGPSAGAFLDAFQIHLAENRIPPKEIPDILAQHLLMLKVAARAMRDAGLLRGPERPRMGCIVGMEFDLENTNFHLRWDMRRVAERWAAAQSLNLEEGQHDAWVEALADACAPPLTHTRTLGALGSLIASRMAREFRFGGPSFTISDEAASGLKALAAAVDLLRSEEAEAMLVGAVDLPGDLRRILRSRHLTPYTAQAQALSLDRNADGPLPGEGAAAVVLKRLADARRDGDRIYALLRGMGRARSGHPYAKAAASEALPRAQAAALAEADAAAATIGYVETHGSGHPHEDGAELQAIQRLFQSSPSPPALGALKAVHGHAGAAAGLASLVKTALTLHHQVLPPLPRYQAAAETAAAKPPFHVPRAPVYWPVDRREGPRRACLDTLTPEGGATVVVLEETPIENGAQASPHRAFPLGPPAHGLFLLHGVDTHQLAAQLEALSTHLDRSRSDGQSIGSAALQWFRGRRTAAGARTLALSLADYPAFSNVRDRARRALQTGTPLVLQGLSGGHFSPRPLGVDHAPVLVFPGSGNHYLGMGRELSAQWPDVWRAANQATDRFAAQCRSAQLVPFRAAWQPGWQQEALAAINADPVTAICGQVVFGCLTADLLRSFGIAPSAVLGYSLGETVGYFATGAWPDRGRMLERLDASDLFRSELAGPCRSVRGKLPIPADTPVAWRTAVVNRPAAWARERLTHFPALRLLIVNTPDECVIGGHGPALEAFVHKMDCDAVFLDGVVAVHCEAVQPVAEAYRELHRFTTTPLPDVAYYSCAHGGRIALTSESAADSLLQQALEGFDFPAVVNQAYADGHGLFLEMGPQASCTRMIRRILAERRHVALSLSSDSANEAAGLARALAILAAEGQAVDLDAYFPALEQVLLSGESPTGDPSERAVTIVSGGRPLDLPRPPMVADTAGKSEAAPEPMDPRQAVEAPRVDTTTTTPEATGAGQPFFDQTRELMREVAANAAATSNAHQSFLSLSEELGRQYAETVELQARLIQQAHQQPIENGPTPAPSPPASATARHQPASLPPSSQRVAFDRSMCLEFAVGSAARVLGPEFAVVDTYPARVRLPDEPLMLVDRILSVEGRKGSLGPGRLVTEHDVLPNAWYLDGERAPVCIAVEAGQADLFLCAYLGIDLEVRGERTYRLLDAAVTFHRGLPQPGEVIRYAIEIEKFIRQGPTWLFFFRFEGTIDGKPLITMRDGCAGFFTEEEVRRSGGIILTEEDRRAKPGIAPADWQPLAPMTAASYDENGLEALRRGDLEACFGPGFKGIRLPKAQRLPGGRMALIDRVLSLDPDGGRYGLGRVRAEADIDPRAWFLTCHFVDDMVMPGTLMYECCAHTLRIYLQRMGWISDRPDVVYEPVLERPAVLKCRGPVTPETRQVVYEVDLREIGFAPEPYVLADAHMYADGHRIVLFRDMSMKMTGVDRAGLERFWTARQGGAGTAVSAGPVFSSERLLEFATGMPSKAFGAPYRPFDRERFIARLPGPPYAFIHRVTLIEPPPWELAPDGWVQTECDIDPQDWYLRSNGAAFLPICILMEIALQACGFLAAYMGSALKSDKDLHFRNLDGEAALHGEVHPEGGPVQTRTRLVNASAAGDMLIEHYAFEVQQDRRRIYSGRTSFGFFTAEALARQAGLPASDQPSAAAPASSAPAVILEDKAPLTPDDPAALPPGEMPMPSRALRMIDRIEVFDPQGGPGGLGYIEGSKTVDPEEWFFKAHFFQDPVCPGSLGIESLIQLLRFAAGVFWPEAILTHTMALVPEEPHAWRYRGQILPSHGRVEVAAVITHRRDRPHPRLVADGTLKCDGLYIYRMQHFGLELRPSETA